MPREPNAESAASSVEAAMLSDALIVGVGGAIVKAAGFLKLILAGYLFGTSDAQDAFLVAFLIPSVISEVLAAAAAPSFIPAFMLVRERRSSLDATRLYTSALLGSLGAMGLLAVALAAINRPLLRLLASGFDPAKLQLTRQLLLILLPVLLLTGCNVIWRALLNAHQKFALAATAPVATPIFAMLGLWLAAPRLGILALALGTLAGGALETGLLARGVRSLGYPVLPRWGGVSAELGSVASQFWPLLWGALLMGCLPLIDNAMAAGLGPGSVSTLSFGTKLATVILSIGPAAIATAVLPRLATFVAQARWQSLRRSLGRVAGPLLALSIPAVILLIIWSGPLVRVIFQKGVFTASAADAVAHVQRFSLLQIPVAVLSALGMRLASALQASDLVLPIAAAGACITGVSDYFLRQILGVAGIALSATVVQVAIVLMLTFLLMRRFRNALAP
jgi:putative peptidoglycan lipid II flippase